jgi:hypothetical protein
MKNEGMRKIVATGYELELVNSLLERVQELFEFSPASTEALSIASDALQEEAVALDMADSLQTNDGSLQRSFSTQDLVDLQNCIVNARRFLLKSKEVAKFSSAIDELDRAWKIISHPDQD